VCFLSRLTGRFPQFFSNSASFGGLPQFFFNFPFRVFHSSIHSFLGFALFPQGGLHSQHAKVKMLLTIRLRFTAAQKSLKL
jgi:hypothetical protein